MEKKSDTITQALLILGMFALVLAGVKYILIQFDIIPDSLGPVGYIDDIIAIFMLLYGANWLYRRIKERFGGTKEGLFKFFDDWPLSRLLTSYKFWIAIAWIIAVIMYFNWIQDFIPDVVPAFGLIDDVVLSLVAFRQIYNLLAGKRK
jgi:uncharacterized membrane protein YkvA (DUF1232 family)